MERLLLLLEALNLQAPQDVPDVYAVLPEGNALPQVLPVLQTLRAAGVAVQMHAGGGSMKSQFKRANGSGARFALVFGADELARAEVAIKPLRDEGATQFTRALATAAQWAAELRTA
jgi:histidyl-tRNA synthetase